MENYKEKLLNDLRNHIDVVRQKISNKLVSVKKLVDMPLREVRKMPQSDQMVHMDLRLNGQRRIEELAHLEGSPYFMKCDIVDEFGDTKKYFFAKHEFSDESIYSWIAPVAAIRFENPGRASYKLPDGTIKTITIQQKEQYLIVDSKIIFYAQELAGKPRDLIYQEHFTKQKSEFALPEIVAQIEKAQDQVIRASHKGPLVIAGPAGSGKTTLALHRVAYLTQAPDTMHLYPPRSIVVFVQDNGTKEYFSKLLPGLGIYNVHITTFSEWAFAVLGIIGYTYVERYGDTQEEKDVYEYQKLRAVRGKNIAVWNKNISTLLRAQYETTFTSNSILLLEKQLKEKRLDRFDMVILLHSYLSKYKKFEIQRKYQTYIKDRLVKKTEKREVEYSLMIVDEFQNYLPEQLDIFKYCLSADTQSIIYVGDMAQQVKLGTIRTWTDIGEVIEPERNIRLNKVYRNTKNILSFIKSLGYAIELPVELKDGPVVIEKVTHNAEEEIRYIKDIISTYEKGSIGIIAKDEAYLGVFKKEFTSFKNIHVLSMLESQGVEFDLVCLVGIDRHSFSVAHYNDILPEHVEERKRMQKDLLYVALTRAITELHVLGPDTIAFIVSNL